MPNSLNERFLAPKDDALPADIVAALPDLPRYADKSTLAEIHRKFFGPLSPRSLERGWPLAWRRVNGRAVASVKEFMVEAKRRFDEAPVIRGGSGFPKRGIT
jgi:hypothetical protein